MHRALAVVVALAACGHRAAVPAKPAPAAKPKLVVLIVIDQYPAWAFESQKSLFTGGIARLLREGSFVPDAELPYTSTFTAAGHATIGTGAPPHISGIVGNLWYRRAEGRDRPAEYDPASIPFVVGPQLGKDVLGPDDGGSSKALRIEGTADSLRAATGGKGTSVAISLKGRAACLMTGKPDLAIWYEPAAGGMTTTPAYTKDAPPWLLDLAKTSPVSRFFKATWEPLDAATLARVTGFPDASPGESSKHGLDNAFPHSLADSDVPDVTLHQTPFADDIVAEAATHALDALQLGQDDVPDLLAISFSAHDYAGHAWGADSWEELDLTMRLDRTLGTLFDTLDAKVGKDAWAAVLTSDHGGTRIVERGGVAGARRIPPAELEAAAIAALDAAVPGFQWKAHVVSSNLYITRHHADMPVPQSLVDIPADQRAVALDAVEKAIAKVPGVGIAARTDLIPHDCSKLEGIKRTVCNGYVEGEAGDILVYPGPGSVITDEPFGTGHDAVSDDDRHVPIIVRAPGHDRTQGKGTLLQVAPTITALLGVPSPAAATEKPLFGL